MPAMCAMVFNDYADEECGEILRFRVPAMAEDFAILVDEIVIPVKGAHWHARSLDILMVVFIASFERIED